MGNMERVFNELKQGGTDVDSNELLKQIAKDIGMMKEQMASMQEQLDRIEQGQKLLAGDVFDHRVRLLGIEGKKKRG